jgi:hypothetical protein
MRIILLIFLVFLGNTHLFAQKQLVYECENKYSIKDTLLQQAIESSIANSNSIEVQIEDLPCTHKKYIFNALSRTFKRKIFSRATSYSFSLLKNGENFFSIERFVFKNKQTADNFGKIICQRKINNLQIESLTYFDFFLSGNNLVFFIADRQSYNENQSLFKIIKENFLLEHSRNP